MSKEMAQVKLCAAKWYPCSINIKLRPHKSELKWWGWLFSVLETKRQITVYGSPLSRYLKFEKYMEFLYRWFICMILTIIRSQNQSTHKHHINKEGCSYMICENNELSYTPTFIQNETTRKSLSAKTLNLMYLIIYYRSSRSIIFYKSSTMCQSMNKL